LESYRSEQEAVSRRLYQIAILAALVAVELAPALAGAATISGVVRDSQGTPQMGALVELLSADSTVIAQTFTNLRGGFLLANILPGSYQMKATGDSFLPTLRDNLRVAATGKTVVNLTLNTLFEAIQWLPEEPRAPDEPSDDWKWTLRSSSSRPLLRFLEDGPLVVVTGDSQSGPQLEARVAVSTGGRDFGQSGTRSAFEVERSGADGGHLILRADLGPQPANGADYLAGYEQPLGPGREIRTAVAMQHMANIEDAGGFGAIQTFYLRGAELVNLGPNLEVQLGSQIESLKGASSLVKSMPFASLAWHTPGARLSYSVATSPQVQTADQIGDTETLAPQVSEANGVLHIQRGTHQELRAEADSSSLRAIVAIYQDRIEDPVVQGGGTPTAADFAEGNLLYDPLSGLLNASGPSYATNGFTAAAEGKLGNLAWVSFSIARGGALISPSPDSAMTLNQARMALSASRTEAIMGAARGKVTRTGTQWRVAYRWQPAKTVTAVDAYDNLSQDAFLSILIRQPVHCGHLLPNGTEALVAVRNLLDEGYRPFLTPDGNTLYFAQASRSVLGGLSFNF
jgi:hypothetical protein